MKGPEPIISGWDDDGEVISDRWKILVYPGTPVAAEPRITDPKSPFYSAYKELQKIIGNKASHIDRAKDGGRDFVFYYVENDSWKRDVASAGLKHTTKRYQGEVGVVFHAGPDGQLDRK